MNKEEAIDLIKDTGFGILATVEGDQPRVRPMMPYLDEDSGTMLIALLPQSRAIQQIEKNPHVEICYVDRKMWFCRVSGTAKMSENEEKKARVWDNIPMLRQYFSGPQDPNFKLMEIETGKVEAMSPHQKAPDTLTFK